MIEFIGFISYPLGMLLLVGSLLWYLTRPAQVKAKQRADYERAHAYKPEEPHGN